jgi:hypothetical protein
VPIYRPESGAEENKSDTRRVAIFEPDQERLSEAVSGRNLSPELGAFLKNLVGRKKWVRKINIPSGHDDAAAVLVFSTTLKEGGLEILSELHVYCGGKSMVEIWEVVGETERIRLLPKESFRAIDITKVRVEGQSVSVEFAISKPDGQSELRVKIFDFGGEQPQMQTVPHPLLEE